MLEKVCLMFWNQLLRPTNGNHSFSIVLVITHETDDAVNIIEMSKTYYNIQYFLTAILGAYPSHIYRRMALICP